MIIRDFEPKYTEEAAEIALAAYNLERAFTQELPEISDNPILKQLSGNGFGVAAFEGGKIVGFLCSVEPFENAFRSTDMRGVFSPMGANGAVMENHGRIYAAMYQAAAKKWVKRKEKSTEGDDTMAYWSESINSFPIMRKQKNGCAETDTDKSGGCKEDQDERKHRTEAYIKR